MLTDYFTSIYQTPQFYVIHQKYTTYLLGSTQRSTPEIIDFFVGPELQPSATPILAIKTTTKGIWQTRDGQVRPACGLFPVIFLSPSTRHDVAEFLLTRQSHIFNPSNVISRPLLTICRMCLAICHHFYFHLLFATHSLRCRTSRCSFLPPSSFSNRHFTTKASQAARHALGTSRPSSITHLGTRKYPTQPSLSGFQMS